MALTATQVLLVDNLYEYSVFYIYVK